MSRMKQTELLNELSSATNMSKKDVKTFLETLVGIAYREAAKNEKGFTVPGIGILVMKDKPARMARNPRTGEQVKVKAKRVIKLRLSKQCKDGVLALAPKTMAKKTDKSTKKTAKSAKKIAKKK